MDDVQIAFVFIDDATIFVAYSCPVYKTSVLTLVGTISPKLTYPVLSPNTIEFTVSELIKALPTLIEDAVRDDVIKLLE